MANVQIIGAGAFVPSRIVTNEVISKVVPGWSAERILEKTGIQERRLLWALDVNKGQPIPPPEGEEYYPANNTDMCEVALKQALSRASLSAQELDAIFLITSTPDELSFNHDAMELHRRLGCRADTFALVIDDGCGGTPYIIDMVSKMMEGGRFNKVAVVASMFTSALINREVYTDELVPAPGQKPLSGYLSVYVFGDAAGAVILSRSESSTGSGLVASMSGNGHAELVLRRGGGALRLPYQGRARPAEQAFIINGQLVAQSYISHMSHCIQAVLADHPELRGEVKRYYFHQPNKRLMEAFITQAGLPADRVACNVQRYGNSSAAGMLVLLAEDLEAGRVRLGSGELIMIAAVGASVHYGAQLFRL